MIYEVWWTTATDAQVANSLTYRAARTDVNIIPGYTTVDDIPQIIAVSRTGRQSDAAFVNVISAKVSLTKR